MPTAESLRAQADRYDHMARVVEYIEAIGRERDEGKVNGLTSTGPRQLDLPPIIARFRERSALLRLAAEAFA